MDHRAAFWSEWWCRHEHVKDEVCAAWDRVRESSLVEPLLSLTERQFDVALKGFKVQLLAEWMVGARGI
eukprot:9469316-Alexandrium_andersonii.AAC.1